MGYTEYIRNLYLEKNKQECTYLKAELAGPGEPGWYSSQINLDERIGNDDGTLSYSSSGGGFTTYLRKVWLLDNSILVAELPAIKGGYNITAMDLNMCIANQDGHFVWATGGWGSKPRVWPFDLNTLGDHKKNDFKES